MLMESKVAKTETYHYSGKLDEKVDSESTIKEGIRKGTENKTTIIKIPLCDAVSFRNTVCSCGCFISKSILQIWKKYRRSKQDDQGIGLPFL